MMLPLPARCSGFSAFRQVRVSGKLPTLTRYLCPNCEADYASKHR